jgi:DNA-binding transcriptional regulator YiaG
LTITGAPLIDQARAARRLPSPAGAKAIRLGVGVTQQQLADELGVDRVTVARWESGERTPRGELRLRYVALLEKLSELLRDG